MVESSSPRYGEKASYYLAVCLETGEVEWLELGDNSNAGTSVAFLIHLKEKHSGLLRFIWDNAPAHPGEAIREYLRRPGLGLRLVNLPGYSPDFNADEAIWDWVREEATGNLCLGTAILVRYRVSDSLASLSGRKRPSGGVKPSRNPGLKSSCETPSTAATNLKMHIPLWL